MHAIAQRHSVRSTEDQTLTEVAKLASREEVAELERAKKNLPLVVLARLGEEIAKVACDCPAMQRQNHTVHPRIFEEMDHVVDDLMEAWMGMHKLATTPMPFPLLQMLYGLMYLWMFTVPFPLVVEYEWEGVVYTFALALALFGINAIGGELEDPLGEETNDLPYEVPYDAPGEREGRQVFEGAVKQSGKANKLGFDG